MKKISIITINYNDCSGLQKTINSIVDQIYQEFEFIIIDGASTDGSKALIEKYSNTIDYWISEKDNGVYHAMNKGIKVATGEFIIFMNSCDCFYKPTILEEIAPLLVADFDIYYGDNYKVSPNSKRLKTYPEKLKFSFFYHSSINHQSTFIRKSLFEKYFYYNEAYKITSDWEFFVYVICFANVPYKYLKKTITLYDFTGISSNPKYSNLLAIEKMQSMQKFFPAFVADYKDVNELNSKRYLQFQYIKNNKIAWKFLKAVVSIILVFLPKMNKITQIQKS